MDLIIKNCGAQYEMPYKKDEDVQAVIDYVVNSKKTHGYVNAIGMGMDSATEEIRLLKEAYEMKVPCQIIHLVVSKKAFRYVDYETLMAIAFDIGMYYGTSRQVLYGIHFSEDDGISTQPHIHYVMNSVDYISGSYMNVHSYDDLGFRRHIQRVCREYMIDEYDYYF